MPNWCENTLTVVGLTDDNALASFMDTVKCAPDPEVEHDEGTPLSLAKIVPPPENIETGGCNGQHAEGVVCWFTWSIESWGTKWDVKARISADDMNMGDKPSVRYEFDSAWAPPRQAIVEASRRWPTLLFHLSYDEPGGDFGGHLVVVAGRAIEGSEGPSLYNIERERCEVDHYRVEEWLEEALPANKVR